MRAQRYLLGGVAALALTTTVHCAVKSKSDEKTCDTAQALSATHFKGSSLPAKTLALTFDDGPGLRTAELSRFLKEQGIQAAFFVNGKQLGNDVTVLQQLVDDGHLIANHTETHVSLTGRTTASPRPAGDAIISELTTTDAKIEPFVTSKRFLFRPPFGDFDNETHAVLAASPMNKYVGPISWDIGDRMDEASGKAADWDCWQDGTDAKRLTTQACGDLYLTEIRRNGRGIVLLHDPYFNDADPNQEGTVDMVKYMVPILKGEGFTFTRVDLVPDIAAQLPPLDVIPDAGNAATPGGGDNGAGTPGGEQPGGGGNDPCPPAPQASTANHGESGNLVSR